MAENGTIVLQYILQADSFELIFEAFLGNFFETALRQYFIKSLLSLFIFVLLVLVSNKTTPPIVERNWLKKLTFEK